MNLYCYTPVYMNGYDTLHIHVCVGVYRVFTTIHALHALSILLLC